MNHAPQDLQLIADPVRHGGEFVRVKHPARNDRPPFVKLDGWVVAVTGVDEVPDFQFLEGFMGKAGMYATIDDHAILVYPLVTVDDEDRRAWHTLIASASRIGRAAHKVTPIFDANRRLAESFHKLGLSWCPIG
jgi:hypothetical protein